MSYLTEMIITYLVLLIEVCGAVVVVMGVVRALVQFVRVFLHHDPQELAPIRLRLGQSLVLGLEFMVGADILRTALAPTWSDLLRLGALIVLRTVLNLTLVHEVRLIGERVGLR